MLAPFALGLLLLGAQDSSSPTDPHLPARGAVARLAADLTRAIAEEDDELLLECVDLDATCAAIDGLGELPPLARSLVRRFLISALRRDLALLAQAEWVQVVALDAPPSEGASDPVEGVTPRAIVRVHDELGDVFLRYFLIRAPRAGGTLAPTDGPTDGAGDGSGERWRLFDWEDLDFGLRFTHQAQTGGLVTWLDDPGPDVKGFGRVLAELASGAPAAGGEPGDAGAGRERLEALLGAYDPGRLPDPMAAAHWTLWIGQHLAAGRYEEALEACGRAEALRPGLPAVDYARCEAWLALGDHGRALPHARAYMEGTCEHAAGWITLGEVQEGRLRFEEAAEAYRRALRDDPESLEAFLGLARTLENRGPQRAELAAAFRHLPEPVSCFEPLCERLLHSGHLGDVEILIEALAELAPRDPNRAYYGACVDLERGDHAGAATKLEAVLPSLGDSDELEFYIDIFVEALVWGELDIERYRISPDPAYAFDALGSLLDFVDEAERLHGLVDLHGRDHPDDPWLAYYRAAAFVIEGDVDGAEQVLRAAYELHRDADPEDEVRETYRWNWTRRLYDLGRGLAALERTTPIQRTLEQLGAHALDDGDADFLERLVVRRSIDHPDAPELAYLSACALAFRGEHETCLDLLESAEGTAPPPDWDEACARAGAEAALALGRHQRALRDARRLHEEYGDPWYEALAYLGRAGAGDDLRALEALEACLDWGYTLEELKREPRVASALKRPAFAAFRDAQPRR